MKKEKIEKLKTVVIIILSLVIVFGIAFVAPMLKNCGTCGETLSITDIDVATYQELLNGEEVSLIYIASPSCGYCAQQEPIMKKLVSEYGFAVNYLNIGATNDKQTEEVYNTYAKMQVERYELDGVRTPTILLVQKGKVLDMNLGTMTIDALVKFIEQHTEI